MTLFGVLLKDLLSRVRSGRTAAVVGAHLAALCIIALGLTYAAQATIPSPYTSYQGATQGPQLFNALASFELLLIVFLAPALTATAISGERERRTFELLLLTRLSGPGIVAGKLLSALCFLLMLIVSSLPVFSLAFMFGGVAPRTLWRVYLIYAAVAVALAAAGVGASALSRRTQTAAAASYLLAFALVFGTTLAAPILYTPRPTGGGPPVVSTAAWLVAAANPLVALLSVLPNPTGFGLVPSVQFLPVPPFLASAAAPPPLAGIWAGPLWQLNLELAAIMALLLLVVASVAVRPPRLGVRRRADGSPPSQAYPRPSSPIGDAPSIKP